MSRRMSCALTIDAVRDHSKTVTRRHVNTWKTLYPYDLLTLIEKGMGLPAGTKQVVLAEVEIISVGIETLGALTLDELGREGFPNDQPSKVHEWACWWAQSHGYGAAPWNGYQTVWEIPCRRIEWRYL